MARGGVEDLLTGTPYRATRVLGRGGMGIVVEAERLDLGRRVAVKILHREIAADRGIVDRLRIEAQTLGRITSPHVVQVLDLGRTIDGRPFLAMEHLAGKTLRDRIKQEGRVPPALALDVTDQMLRGLAAAHAIGIVHRDVKPENVFLAEDHPGAPLVVKVLDFGVAKVLRGGGSIAPPVVPTDEGVTIGTPRYLAPEQVVGSARVDHRADLYAVGLVLWAMLAGKLPFEDCSDPVELARRQIQGAALPAPSTLVEGLPRALDALVARATAKDREERYPDAEAFRRAVQVAQAALHAPIVAPPRQVVTLAMETVDPAMLAASDPPTVAADASSLPADPSTIRADPSTTASDPRTIADDPPTIAADPSTADASTRSAPPVGRRSLALPPPADGPPELPTVAMPDTGPVAFTPYGGASSRGFVDEPTQPPQTMPSAGAIRHAPPRTIAMGVMTPTPPPVAIAAEIGRGAAIRHEDSSWRTFAVVLAVTVVVLGVLGAVAVLAGAFGLAEVAPPVSSALGSA